MANTTTQFEKDIVGFIKEYGLKGVENLDKKDIYPIFSPQINKNSLVYTLSPISIDTLSQSKLEIKIMGKKYQDTVVICGKLIENLIVKDNNPYVSYGKSYFALGYAGGGCLFNSQFHMYENTLTFITNWRGME